MRAFFLFAAVCIFSNIGFSQIASTPCAAGPLPNSCADNTVNLTTADANSGVTDPTIENGTGCNSIGSNATAGTIVDYDVWYTTTVDVSGNVTVYADGSDPVLGIYTGTCASLTLVTCDDDGGTSLDALASASGLTPGSTVWIRVWNYSGGTGTFTITGTGGTPPANDNCASPTNLVLNAAPIAGTGYCATVEASDWNDCETNTEGNVWYSFTIPSSGTVDVNITNVSCFGSGNGVDLSVFSGNCSAFASIGCQAAITGTGTFSFSGTAGTTYTVMVDGDNAGGANSLCDFDIDVDFAGPICGTVDFHATTSTSPYPQITPFPSTMTCVDDPIYLQANDSATAGNYIVPALHFIFDALADNNDNFSLYVGGSATLGSGTLAYSSTLANNTIFTLYGQYLSPSSSYYIEICDANTGQPVTWSVLDPNSSVTLGSGSVGSGAGCTRLGPFSPTGSATWSTTAPASSVAASDNGLMYFDPQAAGPGTYDFTYNWDDGVSCSGAGTHTITVQNPFSATSLSYSTPVCENNSNLSPTITATAGGSYSSSAGLSINSTTGIIDVGASTPGTYSVSYFVGTALPSTCNATITSSITITALPVGTFNYSASIYCQNDTDPNLYSWWRSRNFHRSCRLKH